LACPGGVPPCPGGVPPCPGVIAGVWGPVGVVGGGGGDAVVVVVVVGGGVVTGTAVVAGGVVVGAGFVCTAALAFGAVVRATAPTGADDATGAAMVGAIAATPRGRVALRGGLGAAGAWTTLRPGPGPKAIPTGAAGFASRRGMSAPPATAIASRSAAMTRSLRLMLFPPPADNIPGSRYRQEGCLA
jgi:hypothetical protein